MNDQVPHPLISSAFTDRQILISTIGANPPAKVLSDLCKRKALLHARLHGLMDKCSLAELPFPLRTFRRSEMSEPRLAAKQLARSGYFEPLGHGLLGLATCYWLWHGAEDSTLEEGGRNVFREKSLACGSYSAKPPRRWLT